MQLHVIAAALSFCIFGLGLFLGGGVRPLLMTAMKSEPALVGTVLTRMFSRYNLVALVLAALSLIVESMATRSVPALFITLAMTLILALKLPIDKLIARRESAAQVRGVGEAGRRLERLHKLMEGATVLILLLSLGLFILSLAPASKL